MEAKNFFVPPEFEPLAILLSQLNKGDGSQGRDMVETSLEWHAMKGFGISSVETSGSATEMQVLFLQVSSLVHIQMNCRMCKGNKYRIFNAVCTVHQPTICI